MANKVGDNQHSNTGCGGTSPKMREGADGILARLKRDDPDMEYTVKNDRVRIRAQLIVKNGIFPKLTMITPATSAIDSVIRKNSGRI